MNIKIKFISLLADYVGEEESQLNVDGSSSIKEILVKLSSKYGENFKSKIFGSQDVLNKYIILLLNNIDVNSIKGLDTLVKEGDELTFLPIIAGG